MNIVSSDVLDIQDLQTLLVMDSCEMEKIVVIFDASQSSVHTDRATYDWATIRRCDGATLNMTLWRCF